MSSSQTELFELSDPSAESNDEDTLAQTPPKNKVKLAERYCVFRSEWLKEEGMSWLSKVILETALSADSRFLLSMTVNSQFLAMLNHKNTKGI